MENQSIFGYISGGFNLHVSLFMLNFFFIFLKFIHERHTERERQRHRQRENQAPGREPNMGLDPRSPGSYLGPKAGTQPLSHPGIPFLFFKVLILQNLKSPVWSSLYFKWTELL